MRRKHVLTVNVEDYFHVWAIRNSHAVRRKHWERIDPRLGASLGATLELLKQYDARATFFVFGCIAESHPQLVERIVADGHEIASRGHWPRGLHGVGRAEFVDELGQAKLALERAGASRILGYRSPAWFDEKHVWLLEALAEAGYVFDSSINPVIRRFADQPSLHTIHKLRTAGGEIWEFPITTAGLFGVRMTISGGNYIRQLPHGLMSRVAARHDRQCLAPIVFYFMPWELDVGQPQIAGLSLFSSMRQYRNLGKTRWTLEQYLGRYTFHGIADELGLPHEALPPASRREAPAPEVRVAPASAQAKEATLVSPIFNEEPNVSYLYRTLMAFRKHLSSEYRMHIVLVDDGSTDDTWQMLNEYFGQAPDTTLIRHEHNRGVAAAILTGIRAAKTEIVCSIDCDCSYDPSDLAQMLPLIENADLVTASPYHPEGSVLNVPSWRLFLANTLSVLYSTVLGQKIYTYTSCCRVYRKQVVSDLVITNGGFLGVAETLIETERRGGRIAEYPATLESRLFGESKMKIARTMARHIGMLGTLGFERLRYGSLRRGTSPSSNSSQPAQAATTSKTKGRESAQGAAGATKT